MRLRRLYIGQFPSLHFKDRDEGFVSKGSKDILLDNKIFSRTIESPNESVSLVVIFALFCFHLGRICDLCFSQNCWKSFFSCDKKNCLDTKIIQATSISFVYSFVGNQSGNRKKIHFSLLGSRSEHRFPARSRVLRINSQIK